MSRAGMAYRTAATALAIVWLLSFGLSLDDVLRRTPCPPLLIEAGAAPTGYPLVVALKPGMGAEASGLRPGDRIVRVGGVDLTGIRPSRWRAVFARLAPDEAAHVEYERAGVRMETLLVPGSLVPYWPRLVASAAFVLCTLLLWVRVRPSRLQRAIILMNLAVAVLLCCFFAGGVLENQFGFAVDLLSASLVLPLSVRTYLMFPDGDAPRSVLARFGPWAFAALGPLDVSRFDGIPLPHRAGAIGAAVVSAVFAAVVIGVITRSYRLATPAARRQIKWVVLGLYLISVPLVLAGALAAAFPGAGWLLAVAVSATGLLPVCMLIAVARYNFLDVDGLLSGTAATTVVLGLGIAAAFVVLPPISEALTAHFGLHRTAGQFVVVGGLAIFALPTQRALRQAVGRMFFADRRELEDGIVRLNVELSSCRTAEELAERASTGLADLFGVDDCSVHWRSGDVFLPLDARGDLDLPRFAIGSPLLTVLEEQTAPLCRDVDAGAARVESLGPFQRAVLETLDVPVVVPIRRDRELLAFLCLGAKRSGDVYTPVDVTLLSLVADKIGSEARRLDQAHTLEAQRALQERMRRYISAPLAEQLSRGEEIAAAQREVSILFVDIRGFSSYTEHLSPDQIFAVVNDYTTFVSRLIGEHGGTIVEFNGDGMMAVFGAPRTLDRKEHEAVTAGRTIVERMPSLAEDTGPLTVGVGVATGDAFVGSVQAVDRMIWTALGNTTNLASRLQSLTRTYDAQMLIDEATWTHAGREAEWFRPVGEVAIRGLEAKAVVYALRQPAAA